MLKLHSVTLLERRRQEKNSQDYPKRKLNTYSHGFAKRWKIGKHLFNETICYRARMKSEANFDLKIKLDLFQQVSNQ